MKEVAVYEAKTRLSELLAEVEQGEQVTITRRGLPVARLVAASPARRSAASQRQVTVRRTVDAIVLNASSLTPGEIALTGPAGARPPAPSAVRRAPHDGQKPRRLQLKATRLSWPQSAQRRRRKPWARMPHSRKASNLSFTNCGRSAPAAASASAKKVAACCCTRRYRVVCSGRWRS